MNVVMWMRFALFVSVLMFLALAYSKYFWRFRSLKKIFEFLAFDGPRASAAEQTAHYLGGMTVFAVFNFIALSLFHEQSVNTAWYMYLLAAVTGWTTKETIEFLWARYVIKKFWYLHDSLADLLFWFLGGLTAPLLKMFL